jgi:hypothetical protein
MVNEPKVAVPPTQIAFELSGQTVEVGKSRDDGVPVTSAVQALYVFIALLPSHVTDVAPAGPAAKKIPPTIAPISPRARSFMQTLQDGFRR